MYFNINENRITYYHEISRDHPSVILPKNIPERWLHDNGYAVFTHTSRPETSNTQVSYRDGFKSEDGIYTDNWIIRDKTEEELLIDKENIIQVLKNYRDKTWQESTSQITNGAILQCNDRTRRDIADTVQIMQDNNISEYSGWNAVNGTYTMTISDFKEAQLVGMMEVKKSFDAFNVVIENLPDTEEEAIEMFDLELNNVD